MSLTSRKMAQQEKKARTRYLSAVQHMGYAPLPIWFNDFLEQSVLPMLVRVGFDREIAGSIFKISAPAWRSMGPVTDPKLRLHPVLTSDIREVRQGIISQKKKDLQKPTTPAETSPEKLADISDEAMHPDKLAQLLLQIPTTWIILPRAHSFLTKGDSHCLTVYLQHLDRETDIAFEKILARILIEFIGNYSLKFINSALPKMQMSEAIFYGYAAMFWKNLRRPPPGLEDLLIFRNYLSWAKAFKRRSTCNDIEKESILAEMEKMANNILPTRNNRTMTYHGNDEDAGKLHITLRHGRPGINQAVQYFTIRNTTLHTKSHNNLSSRTLPRQINILFRELRHSYDRATPRDRELIHTFLLELKNAYSPHPIHSHLSRPTNPDIRDFTRSRMACMIQNFSRSLH